MPFNVKITHHDPIYEGVEKMVCMFYILRSGQVSTTLVWYGLGKPPTILYPIILGISTIAHKNHHWSFWLILLFSQWLSVTFVTSSQSLKRQETYL